ncbi:MAG TPA: alpha/beta hydrolase-fold protein [Casimicrobium huifangae]|jgi:phospholipase/carboxylesterase|uniref:alpha/beta hydrolase n=1 Tax=Casimicrobium huifangae TaxID=2591109 RepID=UPI002C1E13CC|nr:alpha/beta hydrolase-fold protein [Casimicrobium huifangae]
MLDCITLEPDSPATACVIWMHGLGADGNDFVPIVPELNLPTGHGVRFVFPNAPTMPVTINGGYVMRAWYDIVSAELDKRADESGVRRSQALIEELIADQRSKGIAADRILLAGFSQGGVIALQTGLRHPEKLAGIMALSTYLACADSLGVEASAANRKIPLLMVHGSMDPVIPVALAKLSKARLETHGYKVEWHEYGMPHSVCAEEIDDIAAFLKRVLAL